MSAQLDGEHWRRMGYELVMRLGSPVERMEAKARLREVLAIQKRTAAWRVERNAQQLGEGE